LDRVVRRDRPERQQPASTDRYSNLNAASGYQQRTVSLAAYPGQTVTLTFSGVESSQLQTSFVLDDTSLNVS
jgi:hypothetical protein